MQKVENLGDIGDQVKVKGGYGRNFLIPQGKAKPATAENIAEVEAMRAELERQSQERVNAAKARAEKVEAAGTLTITQHAGSEGKLFGSVGSQDIAEALNAAGADVEKKEVILAEGGNIRTVGEHEVIVRFHADVEVTVKVDVVADEDSPAPVIDEPEVTDAVDAPVEEGDDDA